jgi:hypothetical protein
MDSENTSKNNLLQIVNDLYEDYKDNDTIFNKFTKYIENLPEILTSANNTIIERAQRKSKLERDSERFIQKFLFNHNFYYHAPTELFFEYKNNHYMLSNEDDIQHTILSSISADKELMDWKYKVKVVIMRKIKDRDIFSCIPESETIQSVINHISSSTGSNKEQSKYFLTVLGDVLLKKSELVYFLNSKTKPLIKELNNLSYMLFGTPNLANIFKFKYYEHNFDECRIIDLHDNITEGNWNDYLKQNSGLNLFCVAAYYSTRYEGGDNFLNEHCKDEKLKSHALYMKRLNNEEIIDNFIQTSIESSDDCSISWKNMQYLWKQFVDMENLPNMFFSSTLKKLLMEKFKYNETKEVFLDCTSKSLPVVSKFIHFWNNNIDINDDSYEELEIDELCSLFTYHTKNNTSEKNMLDLIKHYYPDTFIENNKYVVGARCNLWDKKQDINSAIKKYKQSKRYQELLASEIPINELYQVYCKGKRKFTVSKRYFENFVKEESELYIVENNFIKVQSFDNI